MTEKELLTLLDWRGNAKADYPARISISHYDSAVLDDLKALLGGHVEAKRGRWRLEGERALILMSWWSGMSDQKMTFDDPCKIIPKDFFVEPVDLGCRITLEELQQWRTEEARSRKVSPFVIAHDRALEGIVSLNPQTLAELADVPRVGPQFIERYSSELLAKLVDKDLP